LYFTDQNTKKWAQEKTDIALAILTERKDWAQERRETIDRQFALQDRLSTELSGIKAENQGLRTTVQELINRVELLVSQIRAMVIKAGGSLGD
jgi:hypothetical protein